MSDYEIGYGKPPKKNQFKKGQSGNRKGRPKGAKGLKTDLREELSERVSVTENGKTRKISKQRLILKSLAAKAAKGDVRSSQLLVSLQIQAFGFEDERTGKAKLSPNDQALLNELIGEDSANITAPDSEAAGNNDPEGSNDHEDDLSPDERENDNA